MQWHIENCSSVSIKQFLAAMKGHLADLVTHKTGSRTARHLMTRSTDLVTRLVLYSRVHSEHQYHFGQVFLDSRGIVQALEVRGQVSWHSKTLVATLQKVGNMEATRYPVLHRRLLSAMRVREEMIRNSEQSAIFSESVGESADQEFSRLILKCWFNNADD
jgi:hypothetical protein